MELISAIVPTHNSAKTILRALLSIENQRWAHLEVICVDDASTDNTIQLIAEFSKKSQREIKIIALDQNLGAGVARNHGLDEVTGNYVAFLDADDEWHPEKISIQYNEMKAQGACLSHTFYERVGRNKTTVVKTRKIVTYRDMLVKNHLGTSTIMARREFIGSRRFPLLRKRQDYGFWLKLLREGDQSLGILTPLTKYHLESGSLSRSSTFGLVKFNYLVFRECENFSVVRSVIHVCLNVLARLTS